MSRLSGFHIRTRAREDGGVEGGTLGAGGGVCTRRSGSFVRIRTLAIASPRARAPEHTCIIGDRYKRSTGGNGCTSSTPASPATFATCELGVEEDSRETQLGRQVSRLAAFTEHLQLDTWKSPCAVGDRVDGLGPFGLASQRIFITWELFDARPRFVFVALLCTITPTPRDALRPYLSIFMCGSDNCGLCAMEIIVYDDDQRGARILGLVASHVLVLDVLVLVLSRL